MKVRTELKAGQPSATAVAVGAAAVNFSELSQDVDISSGANSGMIVAGNSATVSQTAYATNSGAVSAAAAA